MANIQVGGNPTVPLPTLVLDNHSASSDSGEADLFNKYFHSVFTRSTNNPSPKDFLFMPLNVPNDIEISDQEVYSILSTLDPTRSTRPDEKTGEFTLLFLYTNQVISHPSLTIGPSHF